MNSTENNTKLISLTRERVQRDKACCVGKLRRLFALVLNSQTSETKLNTAGSRQSKGMGASLRLPRITEAFC